MLDTTTSFTTRWLNINQERRPFLFVRALVLVGLQVGPNVKFPDTMHGGKPGCSFGTGPGPWVETLKYTPQFYVFARGSVMT